MNAFKRLRARFALFCTIGTGCIITVLAIYIYFYHSSLVDNQTEISFIRDCNSIFHALNTQDEITSELLRNIEANYNLIIDLEPNHSYLKSVTERSDFVVDSVEGDYRVCVAKLSIKEDWFNVTVVRDRSAEYAQYARLRMIIGGGALAVIGLLAVASWLYAALAVRPLIEEFRNQNEFLSAIAHELRTPLSVIQMNAENIMKAPIHEAGKFVKTIVRESKHLGSVTKDLMELTKAMRYGWSIRLSLYSPSYILLSAYESYELAAREKGIALKIRMTDCIYPKIECDLARMQQVIAILINNAIQYTPSGGQISLHLEQQRKHIAFVVSDSGFGIPHNQRSKLFEKYYRMDATGANHDHYGLGLYIAMEFVLMHRGELLVEDSPLGGAKFIVRIPYN